MLKKLTLADIFKPVFGPPFKGLSAIIWIYFVFCFLIQPQSQILKGNFPDPDDYLYMVQSIDLLHGQNWFDLVQHRMNPPMGTTISFSHILCLFYAGFIYALTPLLGTVGAATITAATIPLLYFAFFLAAIRWAARPFMDDSWAGVTAYVGLFATSLTFQFTPGHIDHHGLEALIGVVAFGAAVRMIETPAALRWPVLAAVMLAFGMVVGLEMLPLLMLIAGYTGLWAVVRGKSATRAGLIFGLALLVCHSGFLALTKAPEHLFDQDILDYSIVYVILTAGIAACFAVTWIASLLPWAALRYIAAGLCASAIGYAFLKHFPALLGGPYGGLDPTVASLTFDNISEAMPIFKGDRGQVAEFLLLLWPVIAIISSLCFLWQKVKSSRWSWALLSMLLISLTGLAAFYQIRVLVYAEAFCVIPLSILLQKGLAWTGRKYDGCKLCAAKAGIILLVGPLPMVLLPAIFDGRPFNQGVLLFSNQTAGPVACDEHVLTSMLSLPIYYGERPRLIMNMLDDGPELLFRTSNHEVLAASTNENVTGNLDSVKFFTTRDPKEAEEVARRRGVELVVMCKNLAQLYVPSSGNKTDIGFSGEIINRNPSFAQQLAQGTVPDWLKQKYFPTFGNMMLFEVTLKQQKPQK